MNGSKIENSKKRNVDEISNCDIEKKDGTLATKKRKDDVQNEKQKTTNSDMESALNNKSVAKDPKASKVFKSLFTSSETAKKRPNSKVSNWVTYNPYHL